MRDGGAWEEGPRCVADGSEVMRFRCVGPTTILFLGGLNEYTGLYSGAMWRRSARLKRADGPKRVRYFFNFLVAFFLGGGIWVYCVIIAKKILNPLINQSEFLEPFWAN